ncbi:LuxR family maltose regulon positive regulatory protein [Azospirillum fermentarium]|uniref:helix-turn-helix transcriptional regulator n=1 Tax=Azospirillum fermentarium TaxID=1233114 RepID=UPI00222802C3|nr:LuxR C-terminal-related transcriptional regulator [Azospirillum fermentarium]MCW2249272.1 LuxR family maltose regulon positive regulatory protein [Azospirillum fermentarium]
MGNASKEYGITSMMPMDIIKTTPITPSADSVPRERVTKDILLSSANVVALVAPPGFGKSTVMRQTFDAVGRTETPVAWLTLDERDNDFGRLLSYVHAAFAKVIPLDGIAEWPPPGAPLAFSALQGVALSLADAIARSPLPFTVFIDEFESLHSQEALQFISDLAASLTAGQRIVFGSRTMRMLPFTELILQGRAIRIDAERLRFDLEETSAFMANHGTLVLSGDQTSLLRDRTEGWPAGLRLATLALPGQESRADWLESLSGVSDDIATYLAETVLTRQPGDLRRFLLHSSILEELSAQCCDDVLERTDSARLLDEISRANLFLSPVGTGSEWFRFHALFREFLCAELKKQDPAAILRLHQRAAVWHAAAGLHAQAIRHALLADDPTLAADLMTDCAMEFVQASQLETVANWTDRIPAEEVRRRPTLLRARAYAMIALHRFHDAREALTTLRQAALAVGQEVAPEVDVQFALLCEWSGQHELTRSVISRVAGRIGPGDGVVFGTSQNILAWLHILAGEFDEAQQLLGSAKAAYQKMRLGLWTFTFTLCFEGVIELVQGNLRDAFERYETAFRHASGAGLAVASAYLAEALYEMNETVRTGTLARVHLPLVRDVGNPDAIILGYRSAARTAFLDGRGEQAEALLTELGDIGDIREIPRLKAAAWIEKSRLALLAGRHDVAERFLKLGGRKEIWEPLREFRLFPHEIDDPQIAALRLKLVTGKAESIIPELELAARCAGDSGRKWRQLRLRNLLAQAFAAAGYQPQAVTVMEKVLAECSKAGLVRVVADEPWYLTNVLEDLARQPKNTCPTHLEQVAAACASLGYRADTDVRKRTAAMLTAKETEIMRLIAAGKSNKEIARLLYISENTVETHLRKINQKLDVHSRTQAVARLREFGLLD